MKKTQEDNVESEPDGWNGKGNKCDWYLDVTGHSDFEEHVWNVPFESEEGWCPGSSTNQHKMASLVCMYKGNYKQKKLYF